MELVKFLFLFKEKLQSTLKLKYENGEYCQTVPARWPVQSAFVKQQGYALCTRNRLIRFSSKIAKKVSPYLNYLILAR